MRKFIAMFFIMTLVTGVHAAESEVPQAPAAMTLETLEEIVSLIDADYEQQDGIIVFMYRELEITVVTDVNADRMRVVIPIAKTDQLPDALWMRLMQANFDSALDARYAVAQDILWGTFLHRLSTLNKADFLSGIGQSINIVLTFGSTFTSGELTFGGGDSNEIHRGLIDELLKRGDAI